MNFEFMDVKVLNIILPYWSFGDYLIFARAHKSHFHPQRRFLTIFAFGHFVLKINLFFFETLMSGP